VIQFVATPMRHEERTAAMADRSEQQHRSVR
jgi:hypothetical protein